MQFSVSEEIFEKFPDTRIGIVVATGLDNRGSDDSIKGMLEDIQKERILFSASAFRDPPIMLLWLTRAPGSPTWTRTKSAFIRIFFSMAPNRPELSMAAPQRNRITPDAGS